MAGRLPFDGPGARNIVEGRETKPSLTQLTPLDTGDFTPSRTPNSTSTSPLSTSHLQSASEQRFAFDPKVRQDHGYDTSRRGAQSKYEPYTSVSSSSSSSRPVSAPSPSTRSTSISNNRTSLSPSRTKAGETASGGKMNVLSACAPCKKAHLACDASRPCKRCVSNSKSHLCQDVPHKKRGRPKITKQAVGEPYARPRTLDSASASLDPGGTGRWRGQLVNTPFTAPAETSKSPLASLSDPTPGGAPNGEIGAKSDLFEMFATTDLRIIRVTPNSLALTGFHPHEFVNINLSDYIHPSDRYLLESDRKSLLELLAPISRGPVISDRDTQASIIQIPDHILLRPIHGMPPEYPNKNVRVLRSDRQFDWFNVRMHLGSGLGASLNHPETIGKNYLCISLLLLHPAPSGGTSDRRSSLTDSYLPATPLTPATPTLLQQQHLGGGLPSFSSITAGIDGPRSSYGSRVSPSGSNLAYVPPTSRSLPSIPQISHHLASRQFSGSRYSEHPRQGPSPHPSSMEVSHWSGDGRDYGSHRDRRESYDGTREAHEWRRPQHDGLPPMTDRTVTATASIYPQLEDRRDQSNRQAYRGSATGPQDTRRTWEL